MIETVQAMVGTVVVSVMVLDALRLGLLHSMCDLKAV